MKEESNNLAESIMNMLGDNPSETISQLLSSLSGHEEKEEQKGENPLEGLDLETFMKIQNIVTQLNSRDSDDRTKLLTAIRPFLSDGKKPQVDQAIKLLKLSKIAQTAQELDLFKTLL